MDGHTAIIEVLPAGDRAAARVKRAHLGDVLNRLPLILDERAIQRARPRTDTATNRNKIPAAQDKDRVQWYVP